MTVCIRRFNATVAMTRTFPVNDTTVITMYKDPNTIRPVSVGGSLLGQMPNPLAVVLFMMLVSGGENGYYHNHNDYIHDCAVG